MLIDAIVLEYYSLLQGPHLSKIACVGYVSRNIYCALFCSVYIIAPNGLVWFTHYDKWRSSVN